MKPAHRTVLKTLTYKTISAIELAVIAYLITGNAHTAGTFGGIHAAISAVTYATFDHIWERLL